MKKKVVKSLYGVWVTVYEVEHNGKMLWFTQDAVDNAR